MKMTTPAPCHALLAQAQRQLHSAGLPHAWRNAPRWAVLDTAFGAGLRFLAAWHAWRQDPHRPRLLLYSAAAGHLPDAPALHRIAQACPPLAPLVQELLPHWHSLLPGLHRLRLDSARVLLTLSIAPQAPEPAAALHGQHDTLLPPDAETAPAQGTDAHLIPRRLLRTATASPAAAAPITPARCIVIGSGLAGAATARALALRGWQVRVLDRADHPAAGASGLPAGVVAPHISPDDRPLSRLSRAGVRATLDTARQLLRPGQDFALTGVLERHAPGQRRMPAHWADAPAHIHPGSHPASAPVTRQHAAAAHVPLSASHPALWHQHAGWLRPAALVRAMLQTPGVHWQGNTRATRLQAPPPGQTAWRVLGADQRLLGEAELIVLAAGFDTRALLRSVAPEADGPDLPLHPLRGQVALGPMPAAPHAAALPPFPVNGHGSLIAHLPPDPANGQPAPWWITGSTFQREAPCPHLLPEDHRHNQQRLAELLPAAAQALAPQWQAQWLAAQNANTSHATRATACPPVIARPWAAVRATLPDRLPAVGAWAAQARPPAQGPLPLHLLTGLGARGLSLSVLCAELIAAWLHDEPLPVAAELARQVQASRWWKKNAPPR